MVVSMSEMMWVVRILGDDPVTMVVDPSLSDTEVLGYKAELESRAFTNLFRMPGRDKEIRVVWGEAHLARIFRIPVDQVAGE